VGAVADRALLGALALDPAEDHLAAEDVALEEEVVVALEGVEAWLAYFGMRVVRRRRTAPRRLRAPPRVLLQLERDFLTAG
jgi:hypothetical protein